MEVYKMMMACCMALAIALLPPNIGRLPNSATIPGVVDTLYIPSQRPGITLLSVSGGISGDSPEEAEPEPETDPTPEPDWEPEPESPAGEGIAPDVAELLDEPWGEQAAEDGTPPLYTRNTGSDYETLDDSDIYYDSDIMSSIDHSLNTIIAVITLCMSVGVVRLIMKPLFYLSGF